MSMAAQPEPVHDRRDVIALRHCEGAGSPNAGASRTGQPSQPDPEPKSRSQAVTQNYPGRRALVAADDRLTRELLKLVLNQRGHEVDIAKDGEQALMSLRKRAYDVAFLDYELPKIAGSKVAATIRREIVDGKPPRMIAITADLKDLLTASDDGNSLDQLMLLDIDGEAAAPAEDEDPAAPPEDAQAAQALQGAVPNQFTQFIKELSRSALEKTHLNFLTLPGDVEVGRFSARAMQASLGDLRFDGVLVQDPQSNDELATLWKERSLCTLPIVDVTGTLGPLADLDISAPGTVEAGQLDQLIRRFRDRRAELHQDIALSCDLREQLIGRLFVSGRPLTPHHSPENSWLVSYDVAVPTAEVLRAAEDLCARGLLRRDFFDRFHVCPSCDSHRLHVREECSQCRSPNLLEGQYIHHFSCAYQGLESDFRQGNRLVCPKCSQELQHFGFDYDRPGSMVVCQSCSHTASDPSVGFVCLDCGGHVDGDAAATRDIYTYTLTEAGRRVAQHGRAALGAASDALRFADLPLELISALNGAAKRYMHEQIPFTLLTITYVNEKAITHAHGPREFAAAHALFLETLCSGLGGSGSIVTAQHRDFVFCPGVTPERATASVNALVANSEGLLRHG
ncbi:MAG: response regulator, partial [Pseudomonadota bacterium]